MLAKNRNNPGLNEVNSSAKLRHSKQLLKNIQPMTLASFWSLMKRYLVTTPTKTRRMTDCTHIHQPERKTSRQNAVYSQYFWHL